MGAGDFADELGGGERPEAGFAEQLRGDLGDELGDLCLDALIAWVSRKRRDFVAAIRTRMVCSARASLRAIRVLHFVENIASLGSASSATDHAGRWTCC